MGGHGSDSFARTLTALQSTSLIQGQEAGFVGVGGSLIFTPSGLWGGMGDKS